MQAVRSVGVGRTAHITDVEKPSPGPGRVTDYVQAQSNL